MKTPLILRYFLWSMLVFAVSMFALSFRVFDSMNYRTLALGGGLRSGAYWRTLHDIDIPYRVLPIYGAQINQERYLEIVQEILPRLKSAGARVVIVPVPDYFVPTPRANNALQKIASDSLVILASHSAFNSPIPWERDLHIENKSSWWAKHPFYNRLKTRWGVLSAAFSDDSPLIRFVPIGFREHETGEPVSEVATLALKQFYNIPDGEELPFSRSRLRVGPVGIQVGQDGVSYVRRAYYVRRLSELWISLNFATDSLQYSTSTEPSPEKAWLNHSGKIVMLEWENAPSFQYTNSGWAYLQIFGSVFNDSFLTVHNEWNVLLITTLVVLLSVFSYTFRNGWMVVVSVTLCIASLGVSGWLFIEKNVVFEPTYILLPMVLCGFILPLVKTAGEKRLAEEKIKSLEEENRRLLDLHRSAPPRMLP
jgi:hypothetical protein